MSEETIAATLHRKITGGEIRPGTELIQADLASRFSVSRIPVRDALRRLAAEGLITITPNRGARVIQLTPDEVREVYELRVLLEGDCLRRAVPRMTGEDLTKIEHALIKSNLDATTDDWAEGDWSFHQALYAPAERGQHNALIEGLRRRCQMHIAAYRTLPGETPRWLTDHERLVELCRWRDAAAAVDTLENHIKAAGATLVDAMAP